MRRITTIIFFISTAISLIAQNLVPNSSFEDGRTPDQYSGMVYVRDWGEYSQFSSDYYSANANNIPDYYRTNNMGVPSNEQGFQFAKSGIAYSGLVFPQEIIQCRLIDSLIRDSLYYVEFYANLSDSSTYAIWKLGAYISNNPITAGSPNYYEQVLCVTPQILNDSLNFIDDTMNWIKISGYYKAHGGERFLSIGSFTNNDQQRKNLMNNTDANKNENRCYYIDDVVLMKISSNNSSIKEDTVICLSNMIFKSGDYHLSESSYAELDAIYTALNCNEIKSVQIVGNTDNTGNEGANLELSEKRAKTVADYLIEKGLNPAKISYKGVGSGYPIASNETAEGRSKNRRVEIKIKINERQ